MAHKVSKTGDKKNPWKAIAEDGLNVALGFTKEKALSNLKEGINNRKNG